MVRVPLFFLAEPRWFSIFLAALAVVILLRILMMLVDIGKLATAAIGFLGL